MALLTQAPKGTQDLLPPKSWNWETVEDVMRSEAAIHGFGEVRTPVFEHTELFLRSVGDTTDVVEKQMYTFNDKGGRSITLRPEGTAGAVRAMLEHALYNDGLPVKLYYLTSCYRYEKPQAGRLREFHQFGVEMFGAEAPVADAEVICLAKSIFDRLGVKNLTLELNSIGCPTCRAKFHEALKKYFEGYKDELCETCLSRLERNPMRILDCKSPVCSKIAEGAPHILDYLCDDCKAHFEGVQSYLTAAGVEFVINPTIVRGLDYYNRTVFEFVSNDLGAQSTVCGGGRYDGLTEQMGGKAMAGLGFGLGMERLMLVLEAQKVELPAPPACEVYIASMGEAASKEAFRLATELQRCGIMAACDLCSRGLKAQMKYANKIGAAFTVVLGDDELVNKKAKMKNMKTGEEKPISLGEDFMDDYLSISVAAEDLGEIAF